MVGVLLKCVKPFPSESNFAFRVSCFAFPSVEFPRHFPHNAPLRFPGQFLITDGRMIVILKPEATEALVRALGGLSAIAISHPHYYSCMQDSATILRLELICHLSNPSVAE